MKKTKSNIPIKTIPEGAYESGTADPEFHSDSAPHVHGPGVDAQGNGYPSTHNKSERKQN